MQVIPTRLPDVWIVRSTVHSDSRGFLTETFHESKFRALSLPAHFAQQNHSLSVRHTLRGLHYQIERPQGKLVRVISGAIYDVAVDLRRTSRTFGEWVGVHLTGGDGQQLWVPEGFAHGFLVLSETADVTYQCTTEWNANADRSLIWNDRSVGIDWPLPVGALPILSDKDTNAPELGRADLFD